MEIIPAIIAKNIDEISKKISQVEPYVNWVQIDVADGVFAPNVTWNNPVELRALQTKVSLEIHLMIADSARHFDSWVNSGAKRIIVHVDSASPQEEIAAM